MKTFKQEYLKYALLFAEANKVTFESTPVIKSILNANVRKLNKIRDKMDQLCKTAKENGYLNEIEEFLYHENKYIQCITAMYFLFIAPDIAKKVLNEIAQLPIPDPARLQANSFLFFWEKGVLEL